MSSTARLRNGRVANGGALDAADRPPPRAKSSSTLVADRLLTAMASIRRAGRRYQGRPVVLSSLTGAQLELLRLVRRRPQISIAEAAEELQLAPNTVSTLVTQLWRREILQRRTDEVDRRVVRLVAAPDVSEQADAWRDRRVTALADILDGLAADDRRCVERAVPVLSEIADRLQQQGSGA